mmetsp:Transcript_104782/g.333380  ORF Transcript_104782/g.333380 Transcript_104782/m.333380 type:complete len:213 (+) Transcript_104782:780-1418(+)
MLTPQTPSRRLPQTTPPTARARPRRRRRPGPARCPPRPLRPRYDASPKVAAAARGHRGAAAANTVQPPRWSVSPRPVLPPAEAGRLELSRADAATRLRSGPRSPAQSPAQEREALAGRMERPSAGSARRARHWRPLQEPAAGSSAPAAPEAKWGPPRATATFQRLRERPARHPGLSWPRSWRESASVRARVSARAHACCPERTDGSARKARA